MNSTLCMFMIYVNSSEALGFMSYATKCSGSVNMTTHP